MRSQHVGPQAFRSPARVSKAGPAGICSLHQAQTRRSRAERSASGNDVGPARAGGCDNTSRPVGNAATSSPFLFAACWRAGLSAALFAYLVITHRHLFTHPPSRKALIGAIPNRHLIATAIAQMDYLVLALATQTISIAVTSTVFNAYILLSVLIIHRLFRKEHRY